MQDLTARQRQGAELSGSDFVSKIKATPGKFTEFKKYLGGDSRRPSTEAGEAPDQPRQDSLGPHEEGQRGAIFSRTTRPIAAERPQPRATTRDRRSDDLTESMATVSISGQPRRYAAKGGSTRSSRPELPEALHTDDGPVPPSRSSDKQDRRLSEDPGGRSEKRLSGFTLVEPEAEKASRQSGETEEGADSSPTFFVPDEGIDVQVLAAYMKNKVDSRVTIRPSPHPTVSMCSGSCRVRLTFSGSQPFRLYDIRQPCVEFE